MSTKIEGDGKAKKLITIMAIDEQDLELIEKYLHGKLDAPELESFENRLKADQTFAEEVNDYKGIIVGIDEYGRDRFSATVAGWEQEVKGPSKKKEGKVVSFKNYLAMAASLALLLISGYFLFFNQSNESRLFAQYFQPYENITSARSDDQGAQLLQDGMSAYDIKDYDQAIVPLKNYLQSNQADPTTLFYLGEAYLANDQPEQAESQYLKLLQQENHVFTETAQWHLALSYLKQKENPKLEQLLKSITAQADHTYYQAAMELLNAHFN